VEAFGEDVAFWRRPPDPAYAAVLDEFLRLDPEPEGWDDPSFAPVLAAFERRFRDTRTEEGIIMATALAYAADQAYTSGRRALVQEFRNSERVRHLIERGMREIASTGRARAREDASAAP
jgi:hypothetical protein